MSPPEDLPTLSQGRRIVICDYNALLLSVTGLLRMSGYCVFQAYDALAARELCDQLPDIGLLVLNTTGTGTDTPTLVRAIRERHPSLPVLHIGASTLDGMPADVPTLAESFSAAQLLVAVDTLMPVREIPASLPSEEAHPFQDESDGPLRETGSGPNGERSPASLHWHPDARHDEPEPTTATPNRPSSVPASASSSSASPAGSTA